ncbi:MAG: hypothetical protein K0Q72_3088 [Armatimonadetes bacterium]|nr:hypothetical protein [Armatimonadota bacterium]
MLNQPGQQRKQPGRQLVWEVTLSSGKVIKRNYPLQAYRRPTVRL